MSRQQIRKPNGQYTQNTLTNCFGIQENKINANGDLKICKDCGHKQRPILKEWICSNCGAKMDLESEVK